MAELKHGVTADNLTVRVPRAHPVFSWPPKGSVSECPDGDAVVFVIGELSDAQLQSLGVERPKPEDKPAPAPKDPPPGVEQKEAAPPAQEPEPTPAPAA